MFFENCTERFIDVSKYKFHDNCDLFYMKKLKFLSKCGLYYLYLITF